MQEVLRYFRIYAPVLSDEQLSGGRIHGTYRIRTAEGDYIAQKLHPTAFPDTIALMQKLVAVTDYLRENFPDSVTLHYYPTADGTYLYDGWRVMDWIPGETRTTPDAETVRAAGKAFGTFQAMLCDFPHEIQEPAFHDPARYFAALDKAAAADPCCRWASAQETYTRLAALRGRACALQNAGLPVRIVHNDTKLANLLFDPENTRPPVVLDLDTVGNGLAAYDFGDAVRSLHSSTGAQQPAMLRDFTEGFLEGAKHLTAAERASLPEGVVCITSELAARYLTDYLTGDPYFHHHDSLQRAAQLTALAESMP